MHRYKCQECLQIGCIPPPQRRYCKELPLWLPLFGYSFVLCQFDFTVLISVTLIVCAWDNKLKLFLAYLQLKKGYERCSFFYHLCGLFFFEFRKIISVVDPKLTKDTLTKLTSVFYHFRE